MSVVIVKFQLVEDEVYKRLVEKSDKEASDTAEVPELPGVCLRKIVGFFHGDKPICIAWAQSLVDKMSSNNGGKTPTCILVLDNPSVSLFDASGTK